MSNLFTSIPVNELLPLIQNLISKSKIHPDKSRELLDLIKICLNQNYFQFHKAFYYQPDGLAMSSPLSPLLSEIYMDHWETSLFNSDHHLIRHSLFWCRYVEDIYAYGTDLNDNSLISFPF